ncbi:hypothetical protein [Microvirga rosea]|uniref:hypothetical protein n=1 Tax=Microvirga rosea TaxID=2715425 RepID=UPI001D0ACD11|nr:hypothetical protein [Microvirga rosea]MCB8822864.1 hypothetical protein [Microvirga rosea]
MATQSTLSTSEHKEAAGLAWKCKHIPFGTILVGSVLLSGVASTLSVMWSYGPVHWIP